MSADNIYQNLVSKQAVFVLGEQPSPTKLTGAFAQLENAFINLQKFLGNGIDWLETEQSKKKLIPSISSALGSSTFVYKPVNRIKSLRALLVSNNLLNSTIYTPESLTEREKITAIGALVVKIPVFTGDMIGIYCSGSVEIKITYNGSSIETFSSSDTFENWKFYTVQNTGNITSVNVAGSIYELFVTDKVDSTSSIFSYSVKDLSNLLVQKTERINFNKGVSLDLSNSSYWTIKAPCYYASLSIGACPFATCPNCIGNTYDMVKASATYGMPKCSIKKITSGFVEITNLDSPSYQTIAQSSQIKFTVQAPLITKKRPYNIKYLPIALLDLSASSLNGNIVPFNQIVIYDTSNNSLPIIRDIQISYGADNRTDIFTIGQVPGVLPTQPNSKSPYILIGGDYSVSEQISDLMEIL